MAREVRLPRPIVRLALSRVEVAASIGVSVGSVDQMVKEGALPPPRVWHTRKLWLVSEVETYLSEWPTDDVSPLERWKRSRQRDADEIGSSSAEVNTAPSNVPDALRSYYDKLGFDPKTMDSNDFARLQREADQRWKASIPGTPLWKKERNALAQLAAFGVGVVVDHRKFSCGFETGERLEARGFIEIRWHPKEPNQISGYVLTAAGEKASSSA